MLLEAIKTAVKNYIPVAGNKIKRGDHVNANDEMISALYYSDWGIPKPFFSSTLPPEGYVWCNVPGQTVNVADCHPSFVSTMGPMFLVFGGDGVTTIGIPYIKPGSSLIQAGIPPLYAYATLELGASAGEFSHQLDLTESPVHNHPNGIADDNGSFFVYNKVTTGMPGNATNTIVGENNARTYQGLTGNAGGDSGVTMPHNNMPPYFVVNYILRIK